jgi:hypothetical protein
MGGWHDDLKFDPLEFLERLAVLILRPRINLVLYYEVLAPRARTRGGRGLRGSVHRDHSRAGDPAMSDTPKRDGSSCRRCRACLWAELMRRTFASTYSRVHAAAGGCAFWRIEHGAAVERYPASSRFAHRSARAVAARTPPFRTHPSGAVRPEEALRFDATF